MELIIEQEILDYFYNGKSRGTLSSQRKNFEYGMPEYFWNCYLRSIKFSG